MVYEGEKDRTCLIVVYEGEKDRTCLIVVYEGEKDRTCLTMGSHLVWLTQWWLLLDIIGDTPWLHLLLFALHASIMPKLPKEMSPSLKQ